MSVRTASERLGALAAPLCKWFAQNKRTLPWRGAPTPYGVWISEVMLQQTRAQAVIGYYNRFLKALPDVASLDAAPEETLLKLWEGLGYYNRARNLKKAAHELMRDYGGSLPADEQALRALPGFGPYTAGAVASIAFGLPAPAVDGNVLRVVSRICLDQGDIASPRVRRGWETRLRAVLEDCPDPGAFNQALMELGATVCVPNAPPRCLFCPVADLCEGMRTGKAAALPVKTGKSPRRVEEKTILLLRRGALTALRRRPEKGLLAGLWELPWLPGKLEGADLLSALREWGLPALRVESLGEARHIFTHLEWHMTGWRVLLEDERVPDEDARLVWVSEQQARQAYPLPSAFCYFQPFERRRMEEDHD